MVRMSQSGPRPDRLDLNVFGPVATVTINNVAKRNVMTAAMWHDLNVVLDRLAADSSVRVMVLRGAGETFCAGADISNLGDLGGTGDGGIATVAEEKLAAFPKPTLALLDGY